MGGCACFCIHNSSESVDMCSKSATFGGDARCWALLLVTQQLLKELPRTHSSPIPNISRSIASQAHMSSAVQVRAASGCLLGGEEWPFSCCVSGSFDVSCVSCNVVLNHSSAFFALSEGALSMMSTQPGPSSTPSDGTMKSPVIFNRSCLLIFTLVGEAA